MTPAKLHYIHDPLCGWCYGAAALVRAARELIPVEAHGGGMMAGAQRQPVTSQLRDHVMPHDRRIAQLSGQLFGEAYFDGLLRDESAVFDSAPPIAAMLAAEQMAGRGLDLLARLQVAHYQQGLRISDLDVLQEMAADIGLERAAFAQALEAAIGEPTQAHIKASRELLARAGGSGFPSFVLEHDGRFSTLGFAQYLGKPEAWKARLAQEIGQPNAAAALPAQPGCDTNGCAI